MKIKINTDGKGQVLSVKAETGAETVMLKHILVGIPAEDSEQEEDE